MGMCEGNCWTRRTLGSFLSVALLLKNDCINYLYPPNSPLLKLLYPIPRIVRCSYCNGKIIDELLMLSKRIGCNSTSCGMLSKDFCNLVLYNIVFCICREQVGQLVPNTIQLFDHTVLSLNVNCIILCSIKFKLLYSVASGCDLLYSNVVMLHFKSFGSRTGEQVFISQLPTQSSSSHASLLSGLQWTYPTLTLATTFQYLTCSLRIQYKFFLQYTISRMTLLLAQSAKQSR